MPPLNLIVIVADTFRWDHVAGACPDSKLQTPSRKVLEEVRHLRPVLRRLVPTLPIGPTASRASSAASTAAGARSTPKSHAGPDADAGRLSHAAHHQHAHMMNKNHYYYRGFQFYEWIRNQEADPNFSAGDASSTRPPADAKTRHTFPQPGWTLGNFTRWQHGRWQWRRTISPP